MTSRAMLAIWCVSLSVIAQARPAWAQNASASARADALYVRGQYLAFAHGYLAFTSGRALHVRAGTNVPPGTTLGSALRVTVDRTTHDAVAIERDPKASREDEIDIADVPAEFLAGTSAAARDDLVRAGGVARQALALAPAAVTISVTVPTDTPPTDDIYIATDRSNFNPAEIRMQRVTSRRFTVSLSLPPDARVRYEFTRGSYATVERDRSGGIVEPHALPRALGRPIDDLVVRWADLD